MDGVTDERLCREIVAVLREIEMTRLDLLGPKNGDKRKSVRFREDAIVTMECGGDLLTAGLVDISIGGAIVEVEEAVIIGSTWAIHFPGMGMAIPADVLAVEGPMVRLSFRPLSPGARLELAKHLERHLTRY